jgi:hyperosmotically inducible protein
MKKIATLMLSGVLLIGTVACSDSASTTPNAPNSADDMGESTATEADQDDANSQVRQNQLDSDIRATEQRNDVTGGDMVRADSDLSSEVRSKLEANIPESSLTVTAKDGAIAVSGNVQTQSQLDQIESLAKEIKGVKSVDVTATVL